MKVTEASEFQHLWSRLLRDNDQSRESLFGLAHQMAASVDAAMAALSDIRAIDDLRPAVKEQYLIDAKYWMAESPKRLSMVRSWEKLRSRNLQVDKSSFRLRPILEEIRNQRGQTVAQERTRFWITCPARLTVRADKRFVIQILEDLIDNAFYFTQDRIEVRSCRLKSGDTRIEVRDNGPGLSAEAKLACFEPRFTTRSERRGTEGLGLGLPIAREFARPHGGNVTFPTGSSRKNCRGGVCRILTEEVTGWQRY